MNKQSYKRFRKIVDFLKASDVQIMNDPYSQGWFKGNYDTAFYAKLPSHKHYTEVLLTNRVYHNNGNAFTSVHTSHHGFSVCYVGNADHEEDCFDIFRTDARLVAMEIESRLKSVPDVKCPWLEEEWA